MYLIGLRHQYLFSVRIFIDESVKENSFVSGDQWSGKGI